MIQRIRTKFKLSAEESRTAIAGGGNLIHCLLPLGVQRTVTVRLCASHKDPEADTAAETLESC